MVSCHLQWVFCAEISRVATDLALPSSRAKHGLRCEACTSRRGTVLEKNMPFVLVAYSVASFFSRTNFDPHHFFLSELSAEMVRTTFGLMCHLHHLCKGGGQSAGYDPLWESPRPKPRLTHRGVWFLRWSFTDPSAHPQPGGYSSVIPNISTKTSGELLNLVSCPKRWQFGFWWRKAAWIIKSMLNVCWPQYWPNCHQDEYLWLQKSDSV